MHDDHDEAPAGADLSRPDGWPFPATPTPEPQRLLPAEAVSELLADVGVAQW